MTSRLTEKPLKIGQLSNIYMKGSVHCIKYWILFYHLTGRFTKYGFQCWGLSWNSQVTNRCETKGIFSKTGIKIERIFTLRKPQRHEHWTKGTQRKQSAGPDPDPTHTTEEFASSSTTHEISCLLDKELVIMDRLLCLFWILPSYRGLRFSPHIELLDTVEKWRGGPNIRIQKAWVSKSFIYYKRNLWLKRFPKNVFSRMKKKHIIVTVSNHLIWESTMEALAS